MSQLRVLTLMQHVLSLSLSLPPSSSLHSKLGVGDFRLIYRHYATLYFVFCVDHSESELGILDLIQVSTGGEAYSQRVGLTVRGWGLQSEGGAYSQRVGLTVREWGLQSEGGAYSQRVGLTVRGWGLY